MANRFSMIGSTHHGGKAGSAKRPKIYITGTRIYDEMLVGLNKADTKKVIANASRISLIPVLNRSKQNAPEGEQDDSPVLRRTLAVRNAKRSRVRIGAYVRTDWKRLKKLRPMSGNNPVRFYPAFVEYGAKKTRSMKSTRFMLRAADEKRTVAQRLFATALAARITKVGSEAGKRVKNEAKEL